MSTTITEDYLAQQRALHENPKYGVASLIYAPMVAKLIRELGVRSVSDYGAGKQRLLEGLRSHGITLEGYYPYDPAFVEYGAPRSADMVCCIDVLEHIEPQCLDAVLDELASITTGFGFFTVHTGPAVKTLPDGRNAHLIQEPMSWWLNKFDPHFLVARVAHSATGFWVLVQPRRQHTNIDKST